MVALPPGQIVAEVEFIVGIGLTVTVEIAVLEQLPFVPVTVYVVVVLGEAVAVLAPEEVAPALHV
jgi:hypothetical protein